MNAVGAMFVDLYEVTMAQAYMAQGLQGTAVFETFFRRLPACRSYALAAGVEDVLDFLEAFHFDEDDIEYLRTLELFSGEFLVQLSNLRFTGDVWAVPEGTPVFPDEPVLQVVAPLVEAQLVETYVLNQVHLQSVVASKAVRVVEAGRGRAVIDFGSRRAHGTDAALKAARASFLAGVAGTSNLLAARRYAIPAFGTMAHSFVQAFNDERAAFAAFAQLYPGTTLLVDTYDTLRGVDEVIGLAARLGERFDVRAVRLDSGDLASLSKAARARLDAAGLQRVQIVASSGLDECGVAALVGVDSPIDAFGVGTRLVLSEDAPTLDMVYKLVSYEGAVRTKLSADKAVYPGRKQVFRREEHGVFCGDTIGQHAEDLPGEPLLVPVMKNGVRVPGRVTSLRDLRRGAREQVAALPSELRRIEACSGSYPVSVSDRVAGDLDQLRHAAERW
ncbi:MAG: nicotinate phosphoribosyltransferase [Polyangiaceae bacterium]|nr:nicotinate phosphoribosyltransferase [Polyangiaceae bacterium]